MTAIDVVMPKVGQAMEEGIVVEWHFADGARINVGDLLVTIETDKATHEIDSQWAGVLHIIVGAGEEVPVGTVIARVGGAAAPERVLASPRARAVAAELGIDLRTVTASAPDGIVSVADVEEFVGSPPPGLERATEPRGRRVKEQRHLSGTRKTSARRLQAAWQAPHIVQMVEVDATALLAAKAAFAPTATMNDLVLRAVADAMTTTPDLNATVADDTLTLYEGVDVGFAVETERGLVVPVIRGADAMDVSAVAAARARLVQTARAGRLGSADVGGASVTVSNLGPFGIRFGTPVLNLGETVLVVVGAIEDRPVADQGRIAVRPMLTLSVAYDHRVVDGAGAAQYTTELKRLLENLATPTASPLVQDGTVSAVSEGDGYTVTVEHAGHRWLLDEPSGVGGLDRGPDPVSAFLGALAGCMIVSFKSTARRRNLALERVTASVVRAEGKLSKINLALNVWTAEPADKVAALLERAKRGCSVSQAISTDVELAVTLDVHARQRSQ